MATKSFFFSEKEYPITLKPLTHPDQKQTHQDVFNILNTIRSVLQDLDAVLQTYTKGMFMSTDWTGTPVADTLPTNGSYIIPLQDITIVGVHAFVNEQVGGEYKWSVCEIESGTRKILSTLGSVSWESDVVAPTAAHRFHYFDEALPLEAQKNYAILCTRTDGGAPELFEANQTGTIAYIPTAPITTIQRQLHYNSVDLDDDTPLDSEDVGQYAYGLIWRWV